MMIDDDSPTVVYSTLSRGKDLRMRHINLIRITYFGACASTCSLQQPAATDSCLMMLLSPLPLSPVCARGRPAYLLTTLTVLHQ
jgi:hypothetical protein